MTTKTKRAKKQSDEDPVEPPTDLEGQLEAAFQTADEAAAAAAEPTEPVAVPDVQEAEAPPTEAVAEVAGTAIIEAPEGVKIEGAVPDVVERKTEDAPPMHGFTVQSARPMVVLDAEEHGQLTKWVERIEKLSVKVAKAERKYLDLKTETSTAKGAFEALVSDLRAAIAHRNALRSERLPLIDRSREEAAEDEETKPPPANVEVAEESTADAPAPEASSEPQDATEAPPATEEASEPSDAPEAAPEPEAAERWKLTTIDVLDLSAATKKKLKAADLDTMGSLAESLDSNHIDNVVDLRPKVVEMIRGLFKAWYAEHVAPAAEPESPDEAA